MTDAPAKPSGLTGEIDRLISHFHEDIEPKKILVVDDDRLSGELAAITIQKAGRASEVCHSPQRAIGLVQARDYALVLVDLRMPEMSGLEFLDAVRLIMPSLPMAFLTGFDEGKDFEAAVKRVGLTLVLTKPLTVENLTNALQWLRR